MMRNYFVSSARPRVPSMPAIYFKTSLTKLRLMKNLNLHNFKQFLHRFFGMVCLNIDKHDIKGRPLTPREWFVVPLPIINEGIDLILSGDIVNYKYDADNKMIIEI